MQHLYTDDELVALAASASVRWTGPLPTLAIEESDELVRAAIRGARTFAHWCANPKRRAQPSCSSLMQTARVFPHVT